MDDTLTKHDKILEGLTTRSRKLNEAEVGIKGTMELILERLNAIEIRSTPVPNLNCDETGCSVCNITCECNICSGIDATSLYCSVYCVRSIDCECTICIENDAPSSGRAGFCLCSIDCECDLCIGSNTSLGSEGLKNDEREIIRPPDFHSLDDPQVELDLHILRCTRGLDLPRVCFNTLLQSVEIKKTRVASYLFDKMSVKNHVQIVHVFIGSKSKFSLVLVGKGLVVPMPDPGIRLKTPKKVGHKNNVWEILMDLTRMLCLHRSYDNINQVWDTGWQCFMHSPVVHMNSICLVTTISTYGHFSSGIGGLSLHVTASNKDIMLLWDSILQSTLHDNSKKVASIHYGSVDECEIRKAFPRRGSVMTRSLSTVRAKASLEELHDCKLCHRWLFHFILLVAMHSGALKFCSRSEDGATWLRITRRELLVNWSINTEVKLGTFSLGTFWKVEFARSLITTSRVEVVGLHILLPKINDSASLSDGAATVRTMVYGLYFTFDPGGVLNGLKNEVIGLHFLKIQHFNILHQHTFIFKVYMTSFFPIPFRSLVSESTVSSNVVHIVSLMMVELALHLLHKQLDNFCWSMLNVKELGCCLLVMELYYLIVSTPEIRDLPHQFQFDPGISFMKKYCCLSDSRSNFDISTPGSPKYTKGVLISAYIAFSLSHWAAFETFREQLCLLNLAKALGFHWLCLEVLSSKSNSTSLKQRLESFRQNNGVAD